MEHLKTLLKEKHHGGVYWYKSQASHTQVEKAVKDAGLAYFHLEGRKLEKKEQFLNQAAMALHFPDSFGDNWDAFEDCINDMSWIEDGAGFVILFDHADVFAEHQPQHFDTLLEILQESADYWKGEGKPMLALIRGKHKVGELKVLD